MSSVGLGAVVLCLFIFAILTATGIYISKGFALGFVCLGVSGLGLSVFGLLRAEYLERMIVEAEEAERNARRDHGAETL